MKHSEEYALEHQTMCHDTNPGTRAGWSQRLEAALLYGRLLFPEDHTTSTDTEETIVSESTVPENTTHTFEIDPSEEDR